MQVTPVTAEHAAAVLAIYQAGIEAGNATFETRARGRRALGLRPSRCPRPRDRPPAGVIISNCVINLSGHKAAVLAESCRVLRPGSRFGVSDILAEDHLTEVERADRSRDVGCIAGLWRRLAAASRHAQAAGSRQQDAGCS